MGPEATVCFYNHIIKNTDAGTDQEHMKVIIWSDPGVPPRTDAIFRGGESPVPALKEGVRRLREAGADFIAMPCVTAHYYYKEIAEEAGIPFLSLLEETAGYFKKELPQVRKVGLLGSSGTINSGIFHYVLERAGLEVLVPTEDEQENVMEAIFGKEGIKAGFTEGPSREAVVEMAEKLIGRGAEAVIAGCTEIPLVLREEDIAVPFVDPMLVTARICIKYAGYRLKKQCR
ncbi:MAG: aspartate/glutamate racemase family protein [Candidatus Aminicenantes bacterium]|nr:aspartate/glutamate racemase family protein [Candidatus Aminicenantes bacterium]